MESAPISFYYGAESEGDEMQTVDLVIYLHEHGCASADELSAAFDASVRTVRAHVHEANLILSGIAAVPFSRAQRGYRLRIDDERAFSAWLKRNAPLAAGQVRSASDERVAYLLSNLLARTDWVTISDLAQALYVSPQSISSDLKQVEEHLEPFGIKLVKRPRYGVRAEGSEMARRLCLANLVSRELVERGAIAVADEDELAETVTKTSTVVERILRDDSFSISALSFQNLVVHLVVALTRIRENAYVPLDERQLAQLRAAEEFPLAQRVAQAIGETFAVDVPESEVGYIAIHLAGKRTLAELAGSPGATAAAGESGAEPASAKESPVIPERIWDVAGEILDRVWESFRFDFHDDLELRMNLARHLVPLSKRLEYHLRIENPLLSDIKTRFPLAYAMGVEASSVLAERYATYPSEEETGYLALAFALALDRRKSAPAKKNVLVVCASGAGSARLLRQTVLRQFGERVGEVRACDALHVAEQDFTRIDYVFTTVPLEESLPVPVQEISYFLDERDVRSINALIDAGERPHAYARSVFDERLFVGHLVGSQREAVLVELSGRLIDAAGADPRLTELVLAREKTAATAFGNLIALPHPVRPLSSATQVCVGIADEDIDWGGKPVRLVLLVAIGDKEPQALDWFFSGAARLLSDEARVRRILRERTFASFLREFCDVTPSDRS